MLGIQESVAFLVYTLSMNIHKVLVHTEDNITNQRLYSIEDTELLQSTNKKKHAGSSRVPDFSTIK